MSSCHAHWLESTSHNMITRPNNVESTISVESTVSVHCRDAEKMIDHVIVKWLSLPLAKKI